MLVIENLFQTEKYEMTKIWKKRAAILDYAFQPIVNSFTGDVFGYEALLRNHDQCGFHSVFSLLDEAFADKVLYALDLELRRKAISKFQSIPGMENKSLFYNLDNRVLEMPDYSPGNTDEILKEMGIQKCSLYFEISERHELVPCSNATEILKEYKNQNFRIAIDDYGCGYSGLQLLYHSNPDVVKIDRFFIEGIHEDPKKKLFAENIVNMAHLMGIKVVAEGIETLQELNFCRLIGCDFLQGYQIARPEKEIAKLYNNYNLEGENSGYGRRKGEKTGSFPDQKLVRIPPINLYTDCEQILERFRKEEIPLLPVIDHMEQPIGCIREKDLKKYVYSPYGISLFRNKSHSKGLETFLTRIPISDENKSLESLMKTAAAMPGSQGILITREGKYLGVLEPSRLIDMINEKEVAKARDQNPLTHLPGNFAINHKLTEILKDRTLTAGKVVYFDFNNFKPFNDMYGFRLGDRVIILFAEILKKTMTLSRDFIGHIGGDDFIVIFQDPARKELIYERIRTIQEDFARDVSSCYSEEDRNRGHINGRDRNGRFRKFPLLTVSAALMELPDDPDISLEKFTRQIMNLKKKAKASPHYFAEGTLQNSESPKADPAAL